MWLLGRYYYIPPMHADIITKLQNAVEQEMTEAHVVYIGNPQTPRIGEQCEAVPFAPILLRMGLALKARSRRGA